HLNEWHVPERSRVKFNEIPDILLSFFGRYRADSILSAAPGIVADTDAAHPATSEQGAVAGSTTSSASPNHKPFTQLSAGIGEPKLFYSSSIDAPFEIFAVRWNGEAVGPSGFAKSPSIPAQETSSHPSALELPTSAKGSAASSSPTHAPISPVHRNRRESFTHIVTKHLPMPHHHPKERPEAPFHDAKVTAKVLSALITLPHNTLLRNITPEEWDPSGAYKHILVAVAAAAGGTARIYQGNGEDGCVWYWIVAKCVGKDVVAGVSTFSIRGHNDESRDHD
ncbi:uncharacterized protein V1518DRAFT_360357, partial [Limtongia smithiae]|uniref:uncharacterized protein n=1 Tax=Limtongia smithiae TaxID=1125753 RepID=UPI0034CF56CA